MASSKIPTSLKDAKTRGYTPCKVCRPPDIAEDDIPLLVRALEDVAAYLEATRRPDDRCLALAEELKRKQLESEVARPQKPAKRRA